MSTLCFIFTIIAGLLMGTVISGYWFARQNEKESEERYENYKDSLYTRDRWVLENHRLNLTFIQNFETFWYAYVRMYESYRTLSKNMEFIKDHPNLNTDKLKESMFKIVNARVEELKDSDIVFAELLGLDWANIDVFTQNIPIPHGKEYERVSDEINRIKKELNKYETRKRLGIS